MRSRPPTANDLNNGTVELRRRTLVKDPYTGEQMADWPVAYAIVWAGKRDLRGQKRFLAQQHSVEQQTEFLFRWRGDVSVTDRIYIIEDGEPTEIYEITQKAEVGRRQGLDVLARRIEI